MKRKWLLAGSGLILVCLLAVRDREPGSQTPAISGPALASGEGTRPSAAREAARAKAGEAITVQAGHFREWLARAGSVNDPAFEAEGLALAKTRRTRMLQLMRQNPAQAMAESLSWSEWDALPERVREQVEKPFSAKVSFEVLPNCPPGGQMHPHRVLLGGEWRDAFVYGRKAWMTSKERLPARGFLLEGQVVLDEEPVERLSAMDAQAAARALGADAPKPSAGREIVLVGGEFYLASPEEADELSNLLRTSEQSLHPNSLAIAMSAVDDSRAATGIVALDLRAAGAGIIEAMSAWTETPKSVLAVRINYADDAAYSFTPQEMTNLMTGASNAVKVMSYGKTWLNPRVAAVTLSKTKQAYQNGGPDLIVADTRTALTARGINRDSYDMVVHAHPQMSFAYAGLGVIGGANTWLNGKVSLEVAVHELGHNYGLGHAHYWAGVTGLGNIGHPQGDDSLAEHEEYGDPFDIMGGSTLPAGQFGAHGKTALNWIEKPEVINVVTNGIYRIYRFDHKDARTNAGAKLALKVAAPSGEEYWISHRRLFTANASLVRGANIVRAAGSTTQYAVDVTPFSRASALFSADREDGGLAIGKSFTDPLGTIRITTISAGGVAPLEHLDVQVTFLEGGAFSFFTGTDLQTNGLVGTYINRSLQSRSAQDDWRAAAGVVVAGQRVDRTLTFGEDGWGTRAPLRLTGGSDANWDNFSVQWDGVVVVRKPVHLATISDDSSRLWIDLNRDGRFGATAPELANNHWGTPQGPTRGDLTPLIMPGTYAVRIQYQEGSGGNYFTITGTDAPFEVFADAGLTTPGLRGSYVGQSLRSALAQADWRATQSIAGTRIDPYPAFTVNSWGGLSEVGLAQGANGSDEDWDNFSVQWDGFLKVEAPVRMATVSDDDSRMWIDLNTNGTFSASAPEFMNNGWGGSGQGMTVGQLSPVIQPGTYAMRIQYEDGGGGNSFLLGGVPSLPADAPVLFTGLTLNGSENRMVSNSVPGDFTIQFWLRTAQLEGGETAWTEGMGIVDGTDAGSAPGVGITLGGGKILFAAGDTVFIKSETVADDQWRHISARRSQGSGEFALFVDGREMGRAVGSTNLFQAVSELTVGSLAGGRQFLAGTIDQYRMWPTARTAEQIAADYHAARNTHGFVDGPPTLRMIRSSAGMELVWDPLSSYRVLESAAQVEGPYLRAPTDQNATNVPIAAPLRFFRVRK